MAGFLLTAVRSWTSQPTPTGLPLGGLALLWLLPRLLGGPAGAQLGELALPAAALLDLAFGAALVAAVAVPVVRARQRRQAGVLAWLGLLALAELAFYAGALGGFPHGLRAGVHAGLYAVLGLLLTIAGRVVPFFVKSALPEAAPLETPPWLERALPLALLALAGLDVLLGPEPLLRAAAAALALGHGWRLARWWRPEARGRSLLWVLYGAYGWLVLGFALQAVGPWLGLAPVHALHALAIGGLGAMAIGMMARVTLGHTGRDVRAARPGLGLLFALVFLAALLRVLGPWVAPAALIRGYTAAAAAWALAFAGLVGWGLPLWTRPRPDGKPG